MGGGRVARHGPGEFDEGEGDTRRLFEDAGAGPSRGGPGLMVEEPSGGGRIERLDRQPIDLTVELCGYGGVARRQEQGDRLAFEASGHEGQDVEGAQVQPVRVVDHQKERAVLRGVGEQGERAERGQQGVGDRPRAVVESEHAEQRGPLACGQPLGQVEEGSQQLVQSGEGEARLPLAPPAAQHPYPGPAGHAGGGVEEGALARTGSSRHQQGPRPPRRESVHQP